MKRKILLLLCIAVSASQMSIAQIKKGSLFLGGSIGISTYKLNSNYADVNRDQLIFNISPAAGIAIKDNLIVGGDIGVNSYRDEYNFSVRQKLFSTGVGAFIRQYFEVAKRLYIFGQGRFGINYLSEKIQNPDYSYNTKGYSVDLSLNPGLSYAVKKNIHLETIFGNLAYFNFTHRNIKESTINYYHHNKSNNFTLTSSLINMTTFAVGIRIIIEKSAG